MTGLKSEYSGGIQNTELSKGGRGTAGVLMDDYVTPSVHGPAVSGVSRVLGIFCVKS